MRTDALTATAVDRGTAPGEHAFIHIARVEDTAKNLVVARLHADEIVQKVARRGSRPYSHVLPQARKERVRLGYLSADFRDHAIGHLIAGMFDKHDRSRFEVLPIHMAKTTKATSAGASSHRPINSSISKSFRTKPRRHGSKAMKSTFLST